MFVILSAFFIIFFIILNAYCIEFNNILYEFYKNCNYIQFTALLINIILLYLFQMIYLYTTKQLFLLIYHLFDFRVP